MDRALSTLTERASREVLFSNDTKVSTGAATRLIIARIPRLFDAVFVKDDRPALEDVSSELVRLLSIANENLTSKNKFSHSPEYQEALEKYNSRMAVGSDANQEVEVTLVAR